MYLDCACDLIRFYDTILWLQKCPAGMSDDTVRTFVFKNQGHTLGNVLRDQLLK